MASNASLDDQTDEEFFDKLVDEDFPVAGSHSGLTDSIESDDANAFAKLSIGDGGLATEDLGLGDVNSTTAKESPEKKHEVLEDCVLPAPSNSATPDTATESRVDTSISTDKKVAGNDGFRGARVKEVQWSVFSGNSSQTDDGGFGSNSDIFGELGSADPCSNIDGNSDIFGDLGSANPFCGVDGKSASAFDSATAIAKDPLAASATTGIETHGVAGQKTADGQDAYNSQNWANLYPGRMYDPSTGEWHQVDGYDARANAQVGSVEDSVISDGRSEVSYLQRTAEVSYLQQTAEDSYLQQTAKSVVGTVAEDRTDSLPTNYDWVSNGSSGYPAHMVFDPQYPGWYYDMIAQEWRSLEVYTEASHATSTANGCQAEVGSVSGVFASGNDQNMYNGYYQPEKQQMQVQLSEGQVHNWYDSTNTYYQQNVWQSEQVANSGYLASHSAAEQNENLYNSTENFNKHSSRQMDFNTKETIPQSNQSNHGYEKGNGAIGFQSYTSAENLNQFNKPKVEQDQLIYFAPSSYYENENSVNYPQQQLQTGNSSSTNFAYAFDETRSSAGRPAHALVTFGFGGKLLVMKNSNSPYGSQGSAGGTLSIFDLMDVVRDNAHDAGTGNGAHEYFHALRQQSFPGPLVGGNTAAINKWTDERIANYQSSLMDVRKGELLSLLLSLLKISCQHYGKLRSPYGVDSASQESDGPESAVANLFASAKKNGVQRNHYGAFTNCLQNVPTEGHSQAMAMEVQNLLVSGRRKEALQCALEGQLWGPALVLAAQLGEKFYVDTVKQMAHSQFISGSPLRTLCLLIAGQPADVFSGNSSTGAVQISEPAELSTNRILDDWEENLAIITANRTKNDELVMIHLGDCLWKEKGEVTAAHTCYLVAEANFESYSDSSRLCLLGADHWKYPRTYASPEAIQALDTRSLKNQVKSSKSSFFRLFPGQVKRTELYEYSKVLGNSQFILLPFQPYKLIYAYMLAEVGKVSDSLRYCQAALKVLKNSSRVPEVETWKSLLSSLEERIRTHQQGGYNTNLDPAKLVGKLFTSIDRSIHRMIGAPSQPVESQLQGSNEYDQHSAAPKVVSSQSTMAISSLLQSASMEPISAWAGNNNRISIHNRSVSEPNFGRSTKQDWGGSVKEASSADEQDKASVAGGSSRFGHFGSQLFQKTMGWVSRSRPDRQAKLGERNKFYYDEKLKRWVEEGAEPPAEEAALPPPPTTTSFQNGMADHNKSYATQSMHLDTNGGPSEVKNMKPSVSSSGFPPMPPSTNQFSARSRIGVRSRYVDTFNKGGGAETNHFQLPSVPAAKPATAAKFFVPAPVALADSSIDGTGEKTQGVATVDGHPSTQSSCLSLSSSLQQSSSMDNLNLQGNKGISISENGNGPISWSPAASLSGAYDGQFSHKSSEIRPLGDVLSMPASSFVPNEPSFENHLSSGSPPLNGGSYGDLQEVEL